MSGGPSSLRIKILLLAIAIIIVSGTLLYTSSLVNQLQNKERQIAQLYAKGQEYLANSTSLDADFTFLFENLVQPIDFPLILTYGTTDLVDITNPADRRNIDVDTTLSEDRLRSDFEDLISDMDKHNTPITVNYISGRDTIVLQRIHYGDSKLITQLRYYPYLQLLIAAGFVLISYIGFSQIKRSEQSNIWVGMSKETAHQFGTPVSSLMGWVELLRMNYEDKDKVLDITDEIADDIEKLKKITNRFSKIGSKGELKPRNIYSECESVVSYFKRRLPQTGKKVDLQLSGDTDAEALINSELFEWVIENLIKNALDAIEHNHGIIAITVTNGKRHVDIEVSDNGKGIEKKRRKDIFRPGYSTKRRGWGLGLSLSRRIVEVYHRGKIYVKSSTLETGTTFCITLSK